MNLSKFIPVSVGGIFAAYCVYLAAAPDQGLIRPPGYHGEQDFLARCIKCGRCIEACPYVALHPATIEAGKAVGTPTLDLREQACRLCEGFPCVAACPTSALRDVEERTDVRMGTAVIDEDICIAFKGMRCEVCYRVCPLIDQAISIDYRPKEGDYIHSIFAPVIDDEICVGCGLCVERCVVGDPHVAIRVERGKKQGK